MIKYSATVNDVPLIVKQKRGRDRHHATPIEVSCPDSTSYHDALLAKFEFNHWLQHQSGLHGHLIGNHASPLDLHHVMSGQGADQYQVRLLKGEDFIRPDKPHHHDSSIPDNAVH